MVVYNEYKQLEDEYTVQLKNNFLNFTNQNKINLYYYTLLFESDQEFIACQQLRLVPHHRQSSWRIPPLRLLIVVFG